MHLMPALSISPKALIPAPSVSSVIVNAPLPRPIPSFSGKYEEWARFN